MSKTNNDIDARLSEFIDMRSKAVIDYCKMCRSGKPIKAFRRSEPIDVDDIWKWRRDLALIYQGTMLVLQGVINVTGVIPDIELSRKAYGDATELAAWIEKTKINPKKRVNNGNRLSRKKRSQA